MHSCACVCVHALGAGVLNVRACVCTCVLMCVLHCVCTLCMCVHCIACVHFCVFTAYVCSFMCVHVRTCVLDVLYFGGCACAWEVSASEEKVGALRCPVCVHLEFGLASLCVLLHSHSRTSNSVTTWGRGRGRETGKTLKLLTVFLKAVDLGVILIFSVFPNIPQLT